jgi:cell fate regulator YaaT (PSP1 superfamily)
MKIHLSNGQEVDLDPKNLVFTEATLTEYLQKEGGWYNNFGGHLAKAESDLQTNELAYEQLYHETFRNNKETHGGSDKLAESQTKSDNAVILAKQNVIDSQYKMKLIQLHLRAWDKNHENAQSLGHFLRKEMEKLNSEIMMGGQGKYDVDSHICHVDKNGEIVE